MFIPGSYYETSDNRLKKNIQKMTGTLDKLKSINAYRYNWKDTSKSTDTELGFIAQEVATEFPELVRKNSEGYNTVSYSKMTPVLLQAIKEQQQMIEDMKKEIAEMKKILSGK